MFRTKSSNNILLASLRYQRPYWMLHLQGADNWKIYEEMPKDANHQRVEMEYQAWLGGLDRPYVRPRCMAFQPLWLEKKRHMLKKSDLQNPATPLERYVLEWEQKFFSFRGTLRPTADDLHTAFDLVERPLDLSYAIQILGWCRNENDIRFTDESFSIFVETCLRVDRKDVALFALENSEKLGFWHIDPAVKAFLEDKGPDFRVGGVSAKTEKVAPKIISEKEQEEEVVSTVTPTTTVKTTGMTEEEAALAAELAALEEEEKRLQEEAASISSSKKKKKKKSKKHEN